MSGDFTFSTGTSETVLLGDDFSSSTLDSSEWSVTVLTGFQESSIPLTQSGGQLEIGPLLQDANGSHYNAIASTHAYDFCGVYAYATIFMN